MNWSRCTPQVIWPPTEKYRNESDETIPVEEAMKFRVLMWTNWGNATHMVRIEHAQSGKNVEFRAEDDVHGGPDAQSLHISREIFRMWREIKAEKTKTKTKRIARMTRIKTKPNQTKRER